MTTRLFIDSEWVHRAACLGINPEHFFPERGQSTREAKAVCAGCEVRDDCLEYAIDNREQFGIWGGESEQSRKRIRRERRMREAS